MPTARPPLWQGVLSLLRLSSWENRSVPELQQVPCQIDYFIFPEASSFIVRWADHLGTPPERRFHLGEKQFVRTDELILPSNNYEFDYPTMGLIRNRLFPATSGNSDKIYISRYRNVNGRHVINEAEVVIERVLTPRGFAW